ncbi:MAG: circularly permuted type 2 ATP-grasp protein [Nitrospirae bacterium]|nr:circularly permuted type 2 ATP-grasp protein [Nitrospirota bacterium]
MKFDGYDVGDFYDEMFISPGLVRPEAGNLVDKIEALPEGELISRQKAADRALLDMGITFNVYGKGSQAESIWPFDVIPRIIRKSEWDRIERGLKQRIYALNAFINDVYHEKKILKDGAIPHEVIDSAKSYRKQCEGLNPPGGVWCHITGTDLIRGRDGQIYVLEDNLRCPSGVSYVLENRILMKRTLPMTFEAMKVLPVQDYPFVLLDMLQSLSKGGTPNPTVVVLTPGTFNSAYFEHTFLAKQMGVELVEGRDLIVHDGYVFMRTTKGFHRVDVIYRRIDDDFLDPLSFRPDSMLGIPGLMDAYRAGKVALANAPGTGIADDKVIYAYVPQIIKYYTGEDPIIPNVTTYVCWEEKQRRYVIENISRLVVKAANESGGYGMLIGPHSTKKEQEDFVAKINENPRNYIAQPVVSLSRVPVIAGDHFEGRHVDIRPFILYGSNYSGNANYAVGNNDNVSSGNKDYGNIYVLPGGLTRVALKKGSLVVNSSQGGGSKDTWVLSE